MLGGHAAHLHCVWTIWRSDSQRVVQRSPVSPLWAWWFGALRVISSAHACSLLRVTPWAPHSGWVLCLGGRGRRSTVVSADVCAGELARAQQHTSVLCVTFWSCVQLPTPIVPPPGPPLFGLRLDSFPNCWLQSRTLALCSCSGTLPRPWCHSPPAAPPLGAAHCLPI